MARSGSHAEVVTAVALASVRALLETPEDEVWDRWLRARWTKTVRRGTAPQLAAAEPFAASRVEMGGAVAYGFRPTSYEDMPPPLAKMQVAHFERPREGDVDDPGSGPLLVVNPAVAMSTGKTAAQAAHGLFMWWLSLTDLRRTAWSAGDFPLQVRTAVTAQQWPASVDRAVATVRDAGLTETEPGSLTVAVLER